MSEQTKGEGSVPEPFPTKCECGGRLHYEWDHGQWFVHCLKCTPVVVMKWPNNYVAQEKEQHDNE